MKIIDYFTIWLICFLCIQPSYAQEITIKEKQDLFIWYDAPASVWTEAIPIGNAYMGAMIFGDPIQERLQLNETTLYSGDPEATFKAISVRKDFPDVSQLMEEEKYSEAQEMIRKNWLGRAQECYQPLGDLWIDFEHEKSAITNYKRSLDLSHGMAQVTYDVGETQL
ncbi:MAG: glycoside hydrolase N-terminal domain-containing protein [Cyclobacteriaceae bacterium]